MYENNGYQPPYNFSTDPNGQYGQYPNQPPKPPKKKKTSTGLIVGVIAAAIVFGGASGFGGSYLANRIDYDIPAVNDGRTDPDAPGAPNAPGDNKTPDISTEAPITTPEYVRPEVEVNDDLSSLENMANINTTRAYSYEDLFERVNESVVVVNNYIENNGYSSSSADYVKQGTGSGIIFTTDGYIITNYHVVNGADKVSVIISDKYSDDEEIEVTQVGSDSATDIAVLKVSREQPFTAAALGDSDSLKIGQDVAAIGNPAGLNKSLTRGIISGLNRYANEEGGYELSSIQTDAAINPGNSGGGLFDMYGNVIGVVNSKLVADDSSIENLGFAITINEAKPVISDLINFGYVTGRPALGITTLQLNQYTAQIYGFSTVGLLVTDINQDAPVAHSGLQIGDIITKVNGVEISSVTEVQNITKGMSAGDKITVTVSRSSSDSNGYFGSITRNRVIDIEVILTESK